MCSPAHKVKSWKIVTFYLLGTTTAPIQLFLFPLYFGFAKLGLINNVFAVSLIYTAIYSPIRGDAAADLFPRRAARDRGGRDDRRRQPLAGFHQGDAADRLARHPDRRADHRALFVERVPDRHDLPAEGRPSHRRGVLLPAQRPIQLRLGRDHGRGADHRPAGRDPVRLRCSDVSSKAWPAARSKAEVLDKHIRQEYDKCRFPTTISNASMPACWAS